MMIFARICYAALCAVLAGVLIVSGSGISLALLIACIGILPVQLAVNLHCRKHLRLSISAPVNTEKDRQIAIRISLENESRFPIPAAACRVRLTNQLTGAQETVTRRASVAPRGRSEIELWLSSDCCGRIRAETAAVRLYDCFWLIPVRCGLSAHGSVTVQPQTFPMSVLVRANINCPDESEMYSQEKAGHDLTEVFQLRDYREGDSIRQIHWKLSTKYDRLISRDPSLPVTRSVLLFWERRVQSISRIRQDAQAEVLVSFCRALLAMDVQFTIAWNEAAGRCILHPVRELDDLVALLPRIFSATAFIGGPDGAELYCGTERAHAFAHIVYLGEAVSPVLNRISPYGFTTALVCGSAVERAPDGIAVHAFEAASCAEALMELEI